MRLENTGRVGVGRGRRLFCDLRRIGLGIPSRQALSLPYPVPLPAADIRGLKVESCRLKVPGFPGIKPSVWPLLILLGMVQLNRSKAEHVFASFSSWRSASATSNAFLLNFPARVV